VQAHPWPLAIVALAVMIVLLAPVIALRLDESDAGNDPASTSSRHAYDLLAQALDRDSAPAARRGRIAESRRRGALPALRTAVAGTADVPRSRSRRSHRPARSLS